MHDSVVDSDTWPDPKRSEAVTAADVILLRICQRMLYGTLTAVLFELAWKCRSKCVSCTEG